MATEAVIGSASPIKLCHLSSTSTRSTDSTSSSFDDIDQCCAHILPNELILDRNQAIAIEVPPNTLKIDLSPFRPATEVHPEPGDIIEFDRTLFSQWAIYVGDGDIVQIVGNNLQEVPEIEQAIVERVPLVAAANENYCRVNNKVHRARERNMLPFHNEIVVRKALSKVSQIITLQNSFFSGLPSIKYSLVDRCVLFGQPNPQYKYQIRGKDKRVFV